MRARVRRRGGWVLAAAGSRAAAGRPGAVRLTALVAAGSGLARGGAGPGACGHVPRRGWTDGHDARGRRRCWPPSSRCTRAPRAATIPAASPDRRCLRDRPYPVAGGTSTAGNHRLHGRHGPQPALPPAAARAQRHRGSCDPQRPKGATQRRLRRAARSGPGAATWRRPGRVPSPLTCDGATPSSRAWRPRRRCDAPAHRPAPRRAIALPRRTARWRPGMATSAPPRTHNPVPWHRDPATPQRCPRRPRLNATPTAPRRRPSDDHPTRGLAPWRTVPAPSPRRATRPCPYAASQRRHPTPPRRRDSAPPQRCRWRRHPARGPVPRRRHVPAPPLANRPTAPRRASALPPRRPHGPPRHPGAATGAGHPPPARDPAPGTTPQRRHPATPTSPAARGVSTRRRTSAAGGGSPANPRAAAPRTPASGCRACRRTRFCPAVTRT